MNNQPSISIIIPVYQVAEYIVTCLESVAKQDYSGRVEVIIVDDCGSDNSMELVTRFVNQYQGPFIFKVYSHSHNRGLSAARNTGMEHAAGEYVLFVDSDDELLPGALKTLVAPIRQEAFDVIVGRTKTVVSSQVLNNCSEGYIKALEQVVNIPFPGGAVLRNKDVFRESLREHIPCVAWNKLFRRKILIDGKVSFYEGIIHEDNLWSFQVSLVAKSLYLVQEETYLYRIRSGSIMTEVNLDKREASLLTIADEMCETARLNGLLKDWEVFWKMESYRTEILANHSGEKDVFIQKYLYLRKLNPFKWVDYFIMAGLHPIKQLRYFHYAFPQKFGAVYCYMWFRLKEF